MDLITSILTLIVTIAATAVGAIFTALRYRESRAADLREMHETFWSDDEMKPVRHWLSCDREYSTECEPALRKREKLRELSLVDDPPAKADYLEKNDYQVIERLDRFLNFFQRLHGVSQPPGFISLCLTDQQNSKSTIKFWNQLYFGWWLGRCRAEDRKLIEWYTNEFYPSLPVLIVNEAGDVTEIVSNDQNDQGN